ncbi:hypothetical protein EUX98_g5620 [Antrodiella citrinella]|uniref:Uncharacterized protein n=1 Tax=Antrodiella citrinella TaxID=2447956 RepID=A0A4S4MT71_9APHY|nr:hypothetical protein EUX98_g5620 [Antrodiella citrinella]
MARLSRRLQARVSKVLSSPPSEQTQGSVTFEPTPKSVTPQPTPKLATLQPPPPPPTTKTTSKLMNHLKKLKAKGASATRTLLERKKPAQVDIRWKATPYKFQLLKNGKTSKTVLGECAKDIIPFPLKFRKWMKKAYPSDPSVVIDLVSEVPIAVDFECMDVDESETLYDMDVDENPYDMIVDEDQSSNLTVNDDIEDHILAFPPGLFSYRDVLPVIDADIEDIATTEDDLDDENDMDKYYTTDASEDLSSIDELANVLSLLSLSDPPLPPPLINTSIRHVAETETTINRSNNQQHTSSVERASSAIRSTRARAQPYDNSAGRRRINRSEGQHDVARPTSATKDMTIKDLTALVGQAATPAEHTENHRPRSPTRVSEVPELDTNTDDDDDSASDDTDWLAALLTEDSSTPVSDDEADAFIREALRPFSMISQILQLT